MVETFPEFGLLFFVDVVIFMVPEALWERGIIRGGDVGEHLDPGVVHLVGMLESAVPKGGFVRLGLFFLVEEIFVGCFACICIEGEEGR